MKYLYEFDTGIALDKKNHLILIQSEFGNTGRYLDQTKFFRLNENIFNQSHVSKRIRI